MQKKSFFILIIGVLLTACSQSQQEPQMSSAAHCLEQAEDALAKDSILQGETLHGIMLGLIMYVLMKTGTGMKGIRQISPTVWVLFVIFVLRYVQKSM